MLTSHLPPTVTAPQHVTVTAGSKQETPFGNPPPVIRKSVGWLLLVLIWKISGLDDAQNSFKILFASQL
jgi:hypothetical protein